MSGYMKYFDDDTSFKIEDESVLFEYNEIWNKIKKTVGIRFHGKPIYNEKCIKTNVINTVF